jgi:hypothetical protein
MTTGRTAIVAGAVIGIGGLWLIASEPWGLAVSEMIPFIAPGALLGLGAGWISYAMNAGEWSWKAGRNAAIVGALVLPPIITMSLALIGAHPERMLTAIVRAAWLSLIGGILWGAGNRVLRRIEKRAT